MRILILTQHYHPEPNFITTGLAQSAAELGHQVKVITAHPNYPLGKFYSSVTSIWPKKSMENRVEVWRLPMIPDHGKSKVVRGISYLSFLLCAFIWVIATQLIWMPNRVIVYQTPFTTALAGLFFRLFRTKIVYLSADLWPESFTAAGVAPGPTLLKSLYAYSRWINRWADAIITSTRGMRARYIADGTSADKVFFLPLWVDGIPDSLPVPQTITCQGLKVVYAGNIGKSQNILVLMQALIQLPASALQRISVEIIGVGTELDSLKQFVSQNQLQNVEFKGRLTPEQAFTALNAAAATLVHLTPSPLFKMTLPSKLASCLASGAVVICGVDGEANDFFKNIPAVYTFESGNVAQLAAILSQLVQAKPCDIYNKGLACQAIYKSHFERKMLTQKYLEICVGKLN